jgi:hypothetical protein
LRASRLFAAQQEIHREDAKSAKILYIFVLRVLRAFAVQSSSI